MRAGMCSGLLVVALGAMAAVGLVAPREAAAKKGAEEGVEVTIVVLDAENKPIPTAVVRHPGAAERNRVNSVNGEWKDSRVYLPDGSEMLFLPGMNLQLEVSAPGYMLRIVSLSPLAKFL